MEGDVYAIFFICAPLGYWIGLKLASITSLDHARGIISLLSIHGPIDPEDKPSIFILTINEILLVPLIAVLVCMSAALYGAITLIPVVFIVHLLPATITDVFNNYAGSAFVLYCSAITIGYIARTALMFVNEEKRLAQFISDKKWRNR